MYRKVKEEYLSGFVLNYQHTFHHVRFRNLNSQLRFLKNWASILELKGFTHN